MTKQLIASICILGMVGMVVGVAAQGAEQSVTATVCPKNISLLLSTDTVDYGTLPLSAVDQAPSPASVTVTNNGNVTEKFLVRGANAIATVPDGTWTLAATPEADQYVHKFSEAGSVFTALTDANQTLKEGVTAGSCAGVDGGTANLYLKMSTPISTTVVNIYGAPVTIVASE